MSGIDWMERALDRASREAPNWWVTTDGEGAWNVEGYPGGRRERYQKLHLTGRWAKGEREARELCTAKLADDDPALD